ncbi:MAG: hypothetical protein ACI4V7_12035 [Succinivibrionaceae bacterium]
MKVNINKLLKLMKSPKPVLEKEDADYGYRAMYDAMQVNPLYSYFTQEDIDRIREIALSADINANPAEKYRRLKAIMEPRGFYFIGGGTNRRAYACRYDPRVVAKVATDSVGISNNKRELVNQNVLKPYCSKIFEVSPCGTLAIIERVNPIKTQAEFQTIADEVFDVLEFKIRGNNIGMEDIGRRSFKNWGVRTGYGPVLLDYPTMYVIDKKRAFCCARTKSGDYCNGPLQYDDGFDNIVCSYCGAKYMSKSIAKTDGDKISELLYSASGYKDYNCLNKKGNDGIMKMKLHDLETGVIQEFDFEKNTCKYINTEIKKQDNLESTSNSTKNKPLKVNLKDLDNEEEKKQSEPKVPVSNTTSKEDSEESSSKARNAADRLAKNLDDLTKTSSDEESVICTFLNYMINTLHHDDTNMDWLDMNYELCKNIENYMDILAALINYLKKVRDYSKLEDYCDSDGDVFLYSPVADSIDVVTNIIHDLGLAISSNSTTADIDILKFYFEKSNKKYISQAHCYNSRAQEDKLACEDIILQSIENGVIRQVIMRDDSSDGNKDTEDDKNNNIVSENTSAQVQQEEQSKPESEEDNDESDENDDINMTDIDMESIIVLIPYSNGQKVARATLSEFTQLLCNTAPVKAAEFLGKNIELVCAFRDYITTEKADELLVEENIDLSAMTKHSFTPPTLEKEPVNTKSDNHVKPKKKVPKNFNNIAPPKQDSDLSKF